MKINLKDAFLLDRYEKTIQINLDVDEDLNTLATFEENPKASFAIYGKYGLVTCESSVALKYTSYCCRCLSPVGGRLVIDSKRRMITDPLKEDEETIFLGNNFMFEPDLEAKNQIILEFPERFHCSEDCKGLCPVCGCNLNLMQCNCGEQDY